MQPPVRKREAPVSLVGLQDTKRKETISSMARRIFQNFRRSRVRLGAYIFPVRPLRCLSGFFFLERSSLKDLADKK